MFGKEPLIADEGSNKFLTCNIDDLAKRTRYNELLAFLGRLIRPLLVGASGLTDGIHHINYYGEENLPQRDDPVLFLSPHVLHKDPMAYLWAFMHARKKIVSPVAGIESFSRDFERLEARLLGSTFTMRYRANASEYETRVIKKIREQSVKAAIQKAVNGEDQWMCPEGTFSPDLNAMLGFWNGWGEIIRGAKDQGVDIVAIPAVAVYKPSENLKTIDEVNMQFFEPFDISTYATPTAASNVLRKYLMAEKERMNNKFNPDMTPDLWRRFWLTQKHLSESYCPDYTGIFSLLYHLAERSDDLEAIRVVLAEYLEL